MRITLAAFVLALAAGFTARAADVDATYVLAKAGVSLDERAADRARCHEIAHSAPAQDLPQRAAPVGTGVNAPDMTTAVGAALGFALINAFETGRARDRAEVFCLQNLGYVALQLDDSEAQTYNALPKGRRRDEWERDFLSGDVGDRFRAIAAPSVPPLPPYRAETATQGGLKVWLDSLAPSEQRVAIGGTLLTGRLTRWRTAVLSESFATTEGPVRIAGQAGAIFHQVDWRPQQSALLRAQGATWCGPVRQVADAGAGAPDLYCFTTQVDGYDVLRPTGYDWLAGPYRDGLILPRFREPILLEERERDDLEPFDLEVTLESVSSQLGLAAFAVRSDKRVRLWERRLRLDAAGNALLPLWSRRALLSKAADKTVGVSIDDAGDGHGWREGD